MFTYAYSAAALAILSFWLWLFKPSKWATWLFALTLPIYIAFMVYFQTDYITWNEGVTDRLGEAIGHLFMRMRLGTT